MRSRKSRNTWSNGQIWPLSTEWSRAKANRVLPREHSAYSKHPLPTTQEKTLYMDITRWPTLKSDWLYLSSQRQRSSVSQQKQDWEQTLAQIMNSSLLNSDLNWRKWGKTTRPFRYDLNQIPNDYTVEVINRFKGLNLIGREPDDLWMEVHDTVQETGIKTTP